MKLNWENNGFTNSTKTSPIIIKTCVTLMKFMSNAKVPNSFQFIHKSKVTIIVAQVNRILKICM
jgi:hypothetical protein